MNDQLPNALLDYQLEIQQGNRRRVTQIIHDPDLPPSAPPTLEAWESAKQPIGKGGQGDVFLQKCTSSGPRHNTCRALKVIRCHDEDGRRRFVRELEVMARFAHERHSKYFVKMLGYYFSNSKRDLCIALEYFPEGDLHTYLSGREALSESHTQEIISQVLQGLAIMHEAGFAHRDIKPQNVLIQQHPRTELGSWWVKLADFGISKKVDATTSIVHVGTYNYMAPELLDHHINASEVDFKAADLWAVGAMTFYLLTKHTGFRDWRRSPMNTDVTASLPNGRTISLTGLLFIHQTTAETPADRLAGDRTWLAGWMPTSPMKDNEYAKSLSSSSTSSFSDINEIATLATRLTDTFLSDHLDLGLWTPDREARSSRDGTIAEEKDETVLAVVVTEPPAHATPAGAMGHDAAEQHQELGTVTIGGDQGCLALYAAASLGDIEVVRHLVARGVDFTFSNADKQGQTPLFVAAHGGHLNIVKLLAEMGANIMSPNQKEVTPIYGTASGGHLDVVRFLLDQGADITAKASGGWTALHIAAYKGHLDVLKYILSLNSDFGARTSNGWTALHAAAYQGHLNVIMYLVSQKADIETKAFNGWTALHSAAYKGHLDAVRALVSLGARTMIPDREGHTAMALAARNGHLEVADRLEYEMVLAQVTSLAIKELVNGPTGSFFLPMPMELTNSTNWISKANSLGPPNNANLFAISRGAVSAGDCKLSPCVYLQCGTSALAAGGELRFRKGQPYFTTVFQIANLRQTGTAAKDDFGNLGVLHIHRATEDKMIALHFMLDDSFSNDDPRSKGDWSGLERAVWEETTRADPIRVFQLWLGRNRKPSGKTESETDKRGLALAVLILKGGWNDAASFELQFKTRLSYRAYVAVVITALTMWARYIDGRLSKAHYRAGSAVVEKAR